MRTAMESELFPIRRDLIDIISLSKIYAVHAEMKDQEATDLVSHGIADSAEILEVYNTSKPGFPVLVGEVNGENSIFAKNAVRMPFDLKWWDNPACLTVIQAIWGGTPDTVAVRRDDAERLLGIDLTDQGPTGSKPIPDKPMTTTERNTLLRLIIGMAMGGYGYDPAALRSKIPTEIENDVTGLGMSVTAETIRKHLKQAVDTVLPAKPNMT